MDIRKHAVSPTSRLHLRDAAGELLYAETAEGKPDLDKPLVANIYGPGSEEFARAGAKRDRAIVDKMRGGRKLSAEEGRALSVKFLADITQSLDNIEHGDAKGRDLFVAVYSNISIGFIADQVQDHLKEWGNFLQGSPRV